jgi:hypothetical protein
MRVRLRTEGNDRKRLTPDILVTFALLTESVFGSRFEGDSLPISSGPSDSAEDTFTSLVKTEADWNEPVLDVAKDLSKIRFFFIRKEFKRL